MGSSKGCGTINRYLCHTHETAEKHYTHPTTENIIQSAQLMKMFREEVNEGKRMFCLAQKGELDIDKREEKAYKKYEKIFPPSSVYSSIGKAQIIKDLGHDVGTLIYNKLYHAQKKARVEHCIEHFKHKPSVENVQKLLKENNWAQPMAKEVVSKWVAPETSKRGRDWTYEARIKDQKWLGLIIVEVDEQIGKGVKTMQWFVKNQVVCDYHGPIKEGKAGMEDLLNSTNEKCYLFLFKHNERKMCIDASQECLCHGDIWLPYKSKQKEG